MSDSRTNTRQHTKANMIKNKFNTKNILKLSYGKIQSLPILVMSVEPGADPNVQAVSPQVTF